MKRTLLLVIVSSLIALFFATGCQQTAVTSAKVYMQQENYDKAIEQAQQAIKTMPNDQEAYYVLGLAYGKKEQFKEMNEAFTKCLEISPMHKADIDHDRKVYWIKVFNTGVNQIKQDKIKDAIASFELARELLPDRVDSYKNLAYCYSLLKEYDKSLEIYNGGLKVAPEDLELKKFIGHIYYSKKEYDKAIKVLTEVVDKADPNSQTYKDALFDIAYSYDLKGEPENAIKMYQNALKIAPEDLDLIFNMARIYYLQEKYDDAITYFKKLLANNPDDFAANLSVGTAYLQKENYEDAITYLKKATELKPDNVNALNNLGVAYVRAGKTAEGKAAFDKAESLK
ncbi:tetratricopeptide repeat protein [bacterium]|nr:tetratricopeptide repeat protein [bacterium]